MKMSITLLFIIVMLGSTHTYGLEKSQNYEDARKLTDIWLEAQKDYENIPAISGAIIKDQEIIWNGTFGKANEEKGIFAEVSTMTSVCSTSKVFTATAVMKLIDEGKISLDDKVSDLLPKFSVKQSFINSAPITVHSLLSHSSGLPRDTVHSYWSGPEHNFPSKEEMYSSIAQQETMFKVGESVLYSNIGYSLLGMIVEKVSGKTYKNYMEQEFFTPLQMPNSVIEMQSSLYGKQHAIGYTAPNRSGKRQIANFYQTKSMQSAAGMSSTALDIAEFAKWQFRLLDNTSTEIMDPTTLKSMYQIQAQSKNGRSKRGFGYEVYSDKASNTWAMHGGMCPGYVNFLKINVTTKTAFIVTANANKVRAAGYVNGLVEILKRAKQLNGEKHSEVSVADYEGFYNLSPWNSEYSVSSWGNGLMLLYLPTDSLKYALYQYKHLEGDKFQLLEDGKPANEYLTFIRDENGKVTKVKNHENYHYRIK